MGLLSFRLSPPVGAVGREEEAETRLRRRAARAARPSADLSHRDVELPEVGGEAVL